MKHLELFMLVGIASLVGGCGEKGNIEPPVEMPEEAVPYPGPCKATRFDEMGKLDVFYGYDGNLLIGKAESTGNQQEYIYKDGVLEEIIIMNANGEIIDVVRYNYDKEGRIFGHAVPLGHGSVGYYYDEEGVLSQTIVFSGEDGRTTLEVADFFYDEEGLLIRKEIDLEPVDGDVDQTIEYFYDGAGNLLFEESETSLFEVEREGVEFLVGYRYGCWEDWVYDSDNGWRREY